jgi:hypothetical protein
MSAKLKHCEACFNGQLCRGCAACHGTGLGGARYCDGCHFIQSDDELVVEKKTGLYKCAPCRKGVA